MVSLSQCCRERIIEYELEGGNPNFLLYLLFMNQLESS